MRVKERRRRLSLEYGKGASMLNKWAWTVAVAAVLEAAVPLWAQESQEPQQDVPQSQPEAQAPQQEAGGGLLDRANQRVGEAQAKFDDVRQQVNESKEAQLVRAGILKPLYVLAEQFSFPAFHWLAFAVMVTGVVSFALQLTLGKFVAISRHGFSLMEVLTDALGLVVSLVGLVLTTQAAAENSSFTASAFAVLTATGVGALLGIIFYWWGQRQELLAMSAANRATAPKTSTTSPPTRD
jgi:hypothetical protein